MRLSELSLERPVLATVISLMLCVFGVLAFRALPLREMPDTAAPVVSVETGYEGASASVVESRITKPLEDQLSGIAGIKAISSDTVDGYSSVTIEFVPERDLDAAASDVRDAVARAAWVLPREADTPVVSKADANDEVILWVTLRSSHMDSVALNDYAKRTLIDRLSLVDGVSQVFLGGGQERVMNVRIDPIAMAARGITVSDIIAALERENVELPAGELKNSQQTFTARIRRSYSQERDFRYLVIKREPNGAVVRLQEVARVWAGARQEDSLFKASGVNVVGLGIIKQSQANTLDVIAGIKAEIAEVTPFLPEGTRMVPTYDSSVFIQSAIDEVYQTLAITAALVVLIIYIFLGQVRATLIPAVTVPVSLIAAFTVAMAFGYSVNLITMMALILAIGLVVDDAIVVLENIHHHLERGRSPLLAAWHGTREVGFAVIATTAVLVMVFLPIVFMGGTLGRIFTEFAVLLAAAVAFSSLVALTLSPVMGAKLLKPQANPNRFSQWLDDRFAALERGYERWLRRVLARSRWVPPVLLLLLGGSAWLYQKLPQSLTPPEDRGAIFLLVKGAPGASYERMKSSMLAIEQRLLPMVGKGDVANITVRTPGWGDGINSGIVVFNLEKWETGRRPVQAIVAEVRGKLADLPDVITIPILPSSIRGGTRAPVQFVIGGAEYGELKGWADLLVEKAKANPGLSDVDIDYDETKPELEVEIDQERAARLGIPVRDIAQTLETLLGGRRTTTFVERGEEYDVYLRGLADRFNAKGDLASIYVRTTEGRLVSLDNLVSFTEQGTASQLSHYNRKKAITLSANLVGDYSLGEALGFLEQTVRAELPPYAVVDYKGESLEYRSNQGSVAFVFVLALLVVYLILAAQFESFVHPFIVLLTVPLGLAGAFIGLWWWGMSINLYSQIAMIMLIGLVTKNGILIVEFANQLRDRGHTFEEAICAGAVRRLRPILMTAATTVIGAIPLLVGSGAGAESRQAVGIVVFFGVLLATLLTLLLIPAMYRLLARHTQSPESQRRQLEAALATEEATHPHQGSRRVGGDSIR
ncbi:efflux RND transporter permease subunit [Aeromonas schubertii]|uniref:efflux RND transporter permease subunit n=1 Tax=Aeromonas schubertii TaxID=652 RepID=UPI0010A8C52B|nr:efflux RND transporter permease subunit [Aeromonas schubertii]QCG48738.1 efflux RND transporter permease subunit [Aeromonas schubertii]